MLEPTNELGVIVRFAAEAAQYGFEIQKIDAAFPDALIEKEGRLYRAEFELRASSFDSHDHDPRECDLIICWINDIHDCPLPILALSKSDWHIQSIALPADAERELHYWRRRALKAEKNLSMQENLKPKDGTSITEKIRWLHEKQPELSRSDLARIIGCGRSTVTDALGSPNSRTTEVE